MTEIDKPLVMRMHLVVDPYYYPPVIAQIGHAYPGMHGQCIAGGRKLLLTEDLIRIGLPPLELVGIIAGDPILHLDRGRLVMMFGKYAVPDGSLLPAQHCHRKDKAG
jgi:hypothetical protein